MNMINKISTYILMVFLFIIEMVLFLEHMVFRLVYSMNLFEIKSFESTLSVSHVHILINRLMDYYPKGDSIKSCILPVFSHAVPGWTKEHENFIKFSQFLPNSLVNFSWFDIFGKLHEKCQKRTLVLKRVGNNMN